MARSMEKMAAHVAAWTVAGILLLACTPDKEFVFEIRPADDIGCELAEPRVKTMLEQLDFVPVSQEISSNRAEDSGKLVAIYSKHGAGAGSLYLSLSARPCLMVATWYHQGFDPVPTVQTSELVSEILRLARLNFGAEQVHVVKSGRYSIH